MNAADVKSVFLFVNEMEWITAVTPAKANRGDSRNVAGKRKGGLKDKVSMFLSAFDSSPLCGLRESGEQVTYSCSASSPLTSHWGPSTHSS